MNYTLILLAVGFVAGFVVRSMFSFSFIFLILVVLAGAGGWLWYNTSGRGFLQRLRR